MEQDKFVKQIDFALARIDNKSFALIAVRFALAITTKRDQHARIRVCVLCTRSAVFDFSLAVAWANRNATLQVDVDGMLA